MKNIVIHDDVREVEIRPDETFDSYLELVKKDVGKYFPTKKLIPCGCPACDSTKGKVAFNKFGMDYVECLNCHSLFVSPRPDDDALHAFYIDSAARKYWKEHLMAETATKRMEKIYRPRIEWIESMSGEYLTAIESYTDINTYYLPYIEQMRAKNPKATIRIVDPFSSFSLQQKQNKVFDIIEQTLPLTNLNAISQVISAFDVINRISDLKAFVVSVKKNLIGGGLFFISALSISGFDMQILWDTSKNIYPPDRLNLLSIEGLTILFEKNGFKIIELSTPGLLDVDIVAKNLTKDITNRIPRFVRYLIQNRDAYTQNEFQSFLQQNRLSSFVRMVLMKK